MITNPVFTREMRVSARSVKMPLIICIFNIILALFVLISMTITIGQAKQSAEISYANFLTIFRYVATIEFGLLLFIMPALTATSISGEREHRTLDVVLTTKIKPSGIVYGKLATALTTMLLLVISSFPILVLALAYGGVTILDIVTIFLCNMVVSILSGSIGIWASSIAKRSTTSTILAYAMLLIIGGGTFGLVMLSERAFASLGSLVYILRINPIMTFYETIWYGADLLTYLGLVIQLVLAGIFTALAVKNLR